MPYIGNIVQDFSVNNAMLNTDSVTSIKIDDGTIVNADINDSAAIAVSKLANFVTNNAANRVITGSGTTNTLNGNSDLLWNGSRLDIDTGGTEDALRIGNTAGTDTFIRLGSIGTTADTHAVIKYDKDDNYLSLLVSGESHGNGGMLIANGGAVSLSAGTSPLAKLHVKDDVYVKGSSGDGSTGIQIRSGSSAISGQHQVRTGGGLGNMLIINAAGSTGLLQVQTNGTEKLRIDSSGQVGIGTSSPEEDLHISNDTPVIRLTDSSTNRHAQFVCIDGSLRLDADNNNAQSNTNIAFRTDGTERMRIDSSGRLLIGTTSGTGHSLTGTNNPLLQVESASSNDYARASFIFNGATSVGPGLWFGKSRGTSVGSNTIVNDGDQVGGFFFHAADGTDKFSRVASIEVKVDGTPGSNDTPGRITFATTADGADGTTERMRIDSSGRVGIGTTSPAQLLEIHGASNPAVLLKDTTNNVLSYLYSQDLVGAVGTASNHPFVFNVNNGEKMRIDSSGNVSIGTTSTTMNANGLKVFHTTQPGIQLQNNNSGTTGSDGAEITLTNGGTLLIGNREAGNRIGLQTVASGGSTLVEVVRIEENKKCSFNGSNTTACDIDIEGTTVEIGNPLGNNVSAGQNPVFRAQANNSNKSIMFSSMWGGDNGVHKQLEFSGGNRIVYNGTNDNEMARFTSDDFLVGTTSNSSSTGIGLKLNFGATNPTFNTVINQSAGNHSFYHLYNTNSTHNGYRFYVQVNGGIANHSGNNVNLSDERMKKNITNMGSVYSTFKQFVFRDFNYIDDEASESKKHGVIAQEVETIDADLITDDFKIGGDKDENYVYRKALKEEQFVMIGLKALQEAIAKIDTLETKVAALEAA